LRALQKRGFTVRALTRDTGSPKAKALADKGVEVVAGDLTDRASLDGALRGAHGAYSVQALAGKEGEEERQGIAIAEAAAGAMGEQKPLQLIAVEDIGEIAARAFAEPDRFLGKAIEIAGDERTLPQIQEAFRVKTGRKERAFPFPRFMLGVLPFDLRTMIRWFGSAGYQADLPAVRAISPGVLTLA